MKDVMSKIILSAALLLVALGFGLWTASKKKPAAQIDLSVEASVTEKILPKAMSETEAQLPGLNEAIGEVQSSKIEDFRAWSNQVLAGLPTKQQVQQDEAFTGEGSPKALEEGAVSVTELYSYVVENPNVKTAAIETFKNCASNNEGLDAIRAYCYSKAVRLTLELGGDFWDPSNVPDAIKKLSRSL